MKVRCISAGNALNPGMSRGFQGLRLALDERVSSAAVYGVAVENWLGVLEG